MLEVILNAYIHDINRFIKIESWKFDKPINESKSDVISKVLKDAL